MAIYARRLRLDLPSKSVNLKTNRICDHVAKSVVACTLCQKHQQHLTKMPRAAQTSAVGKSSKDKKTKPTKRPAEDEMGELPGVDEQAEAHAAARAQKKKKQKKAAEVAAEEEVDEEESQAGDEGEEETALDPAVQAARLRRRREHRRVSGYRAKAQECGFFPNAGVAAAGGADSLMSALTAADAKRLMRFVPEVLNKSSFDKAECAARMKLSRESVPASAARETQARCEAVMRKLMRDAVLRTAEKGAMRVDASTMAAVLRPFHFNIQFSSFLPPRGLVRHAQAAGVLSASAADNETVEQEKAENKELSTAAKKIESDEIKRKEAFQKRKGDLRLERAEKAGAVVQVA